MGPTPNRTTVDLSTYPDLVVIYLGMRVNAPGGLTTLISFGSKIRKSVEAQPDGLLLCQRSLRNPGERSGDLLAGGHQKSRLVAF